MLDYGLRRGRDFREGLRPSSTLLLPPPTPHSQQQVETSVVLGIEVQKKPKETSR